MGITGTKGKEKDVTIEEMLALQAELDEARREYGVAPKEGRISRLISGYFDRKEARKKHAVVRKTYLLLAVFTGWFGGHRFYAKQYPVAVLYLLLFWTGFPFAMTLIDLIAAVPIAADEEGRIWL